MSSTNCCFLTCIQISQETSKVVIPFHLFKNFPQFVVIHTVKDFSIVNEAEVYVFLELYCFLWSNRCWQFDLWFLCLFLVQLKHLEVHGSYTVEAWLGKFLHYFACMWNKYNCALVWAFFGIAFLWDWNENWPLPVLWQLLSFANLLPYWALSQHHLFGFEIVQFPHLNSHSRMFGSRWVVTPSWFSGFWRSFLCHFPVYSCHLFLISSAFVNEVNESCSVVSNSLRPHGLYSPWNSPGQNIGVNRLSLLQGVIPTQGWNVGLLHCRQILYQLSHKGSPLLLLVPCHFCPLLCSSLCEMFPKYL